MSLRDDGGARAITRLASSGRTLPPDISASGIHRGAKPVSQCLGSDEKPYGDAAGLRLKRASGPFNGNQLGRLNRSVGTGFEPASR